MSLDPLHVGIILVLLVVGAITILGWAIHRRYAVSVRWRTGYLDLTPPSETKDPDETKQ